MDFSQQDGKDEKRKKLKLSFTLSAPSLNFGKTPSPGQTGVSNNGNSTTSASHHHNSTSTSSLSGGGGNNFLFTSSVGGGGGGGGVGGGGGGSCSNSTTPTYNCCSNSSSNSSLSSLGSSNANYQFGNSFTSDYPTQIERLRNRNICWSSGKLKISPDQEYDFTAEDLVDIEEIGRGNYGNVNRMFHERSDTVMAVKRIRATVDEKEKKQLSMDLDVVVKSNDCPNIVLFYGAIFWEGDCWICMELMDISLHKFYKFIHGPGNSYIPEPVLGKIVVATVKALNYLKEKLKIIHRDVKPSNILLDKKGNIKLCDFGISGQLVDSIAKTRDVGCRPYMAPERIDPSSSKQGYDIRSDVWSLGISIIEVATGKFPYPKWSSVFEQLTQVVKGEPPRLSQRSDFRFSPDFINFVNLCLTKEVSNRPKYKALLTHPFIKYSDEMEEDVAGYVCDVLEKLDVISPNRNYLTEDST